MVDGGVIARVSGAVVIDRADVFKVGGAGIQIESYGEPADCVHAFIGTKVRNAAGGGLAVYGDRCRVLVLGGAYTDNRFAGVALIDTGSAIVQGTDLSRTSPLAGAFGDGLLAWSTAVEVRGVTSSDNASGGLTIVGCPGGDEGSIDVVDTTFACNAIDIIRGGFPDCGLGASINDSGGNECGCGATKAACTA